MWYSIEHMFLGNFLVSGQSETDSSCVDPLFCVEAKGLSQHIG